MASGQGLTPSTSIAGTLARVGMDAVMLAGALEARGVETVPHLTTRDLNVIGLQAALLGAWSIGGVRNVLAITGDPPSLGDHPETTGVFEIDSGDWLGEGDDDRLNQMEPTGQGRRWAEPPTLRSAWRSTRWRRIWMRRSRASWRVQRRQAHTLR